MEEQKHRSLQDEAEDFFNHNYSGTESSDFLKPYIINTYIAAKSQFKPSVEQSEKVDRKLITEQREMCEVIRCKCGNIFAGCMLSHISDPEWQEDVKEYNAKGCTIERISSRDFSFSKCTCPQTSSDKVENRVEKPDFAELALRNACLTCEPSYAAGCEKIWTTYVTPLQSRLSELQDTFDTFKRGIAKGEELYAHLKFDDAEFTPYQLALQKVESLQSEKERLLSALKDQILDDLEMDILLYEDDWSRGPQSKFGDFKKRIMSQSKPLYPF